MAEAELVCDRVALLHRGRLLACDTVAGLRARFARPTLAEAFLTAIEQADAPDVTSSGAASGARDDEGDA
jgi:ribosome-dependent ATPase